MKHAFIATPVHGSPDPEYSASLIVTQGVLSAAGVAYTHSFVVGNALVHDARNQLVAWFLNSPATDLLFIDADIAWDGRDALALIKAEQDVIGGVYLQKRPDQEIYNVGGVRPGPNGTLVCDYLGAGFLKISRGAILKMIESYPETAYMGRDGAQMWGLFDAPIKDGKIVGEDATFLRRWREIGGEVYVAPNMTLTHFGRYGWRGNFAQLVARERTGKAA